MDSCTYFMESWPIISSLLTTFRCLHEHSLYFLCVVCMNYKVCSHTVSSKGDHNSPHPRPNVKFEPGKIAPCLWIERVLCDRGYMCLSFVSWVRRGPSLSNLRLGNSSSVCTEMTCQANPRLKGFGAVWTGDSGCLGTLGSAVFPLFPTLLSCCDSACFMFLGAMVYSWSPLRPLHGCLLPLSVIDVEGFQWDFQWIFEAFLLASLWLYDCVDTF